MKKPFYVVWGQYYNPVTDYYVERMLGCYQNKIRAEKTVDALRNNYSGASYCVREEYFCDEESEQGKVK